MTTTTKAEPFAGPVDVNELKGVSYELFVLLVSLLSVVNTAIVLLPFEEPLKQVALVVDSILAPVFAVDFAYRLITTRPRRTYLVRRYGWADALAVLPTLGVFRIFRVVRVIRLLRMQGSQQILAELDQGRAQATFLLTLFLVFVVVEFAGMAMFVVESPVAGANITSASDAIWWGFVTITTVGYGDRYPTTDTGRVVGTLLLFAGIALFSVLTGFIANAFLAPREGRIRRRGEHRPPLELEIEELRAMLIEQEERAGAIRRKLDDVERSADAAGAAER